MNISKMFKFNQYTQKLEPVDCFLPTWEARVYLRTAFKVARGRLDIEKASEYRERLKSRYRAIVGM